jgi:hypothetical protein
LDQTIELGLILDLPRAPQKLTLALTGPGDQLAQRYRHVPASKQSTDVLDSLSDQLRFLSPTLPQLEFPITAATGGPRGERKPEKEERDCKEEDCRNLVGCANEFHDFPLR